MLFSILLVLTAVLLAGRSSGQQPTQSQTQATAADGSVSAVAGPIGPGDVLDISILGVPELTQRVRVENNGSISLPLVGTFRVEGMSAREVELALAQRLVSMQLLVNPQVSIFVQQSIGSRVKVLGEVNAQGVYQLIGRQTVLDAVASAGGPNTRASRTVDVLHTDGTQETINLNGPEANAQRLHSGDTVTVRRAPVIYVIGEVQRPGGFIANDERLTSSVLEALALSGGPTRLAKLSDTLILRRTATGVQKRNVPINHLVKGQLEDMPVTDGDIIYVPLSHAKQNAERIIDAAFSVGTGLLIYRY